MPSRLSQQVWAYAYPWADQPSPGSVGTSCLTWALSQPGEREIGARALTCPCASPERPRVGELEAPVSIVGAQLQAPPRTLADHAVCEVPRFRSVYLSTTRAANRSGELRRTAANADEQVNLPEPRPK